MKMATTVEQFYLLGGQPEEMFLSRLPVAKLRKRSEIHAAIAAASKHVSIWIATKSDSTDELLREAFTGRIQRRLGRLLMLFPPRPDSLPAIEELFSPVAWGTKTFKLLTLEELAEAVIADNRHDLFIGGFVDSNTDTLILYRGDFERVAVPLSVFRQLGAGAKPDASRLSFTDYGQTVCLSGYEAASEAILYEVDPAYRRDVNARRRDQDKSFGASLRRLRVLKGLRQSDFGVIPAKTIARIERSETGKPQRVTLQRIAKHLGVEAEQIETY